MKIFTVAELLELESGMQISAIKGTLVEVWPAKTRNVQGEKKQVQDLKLEDDTGSIKISNWGEPFSKADKGETFIIESHKGPKGLKGLVLKDDDYNNTKQISMSDSAKIKNPDGTTAPNRAPEGKTSGKESAPTRDPFKVADEAAAGLSLAMDRAIRIAQDKTDAMSKLTGESFTADSVIQLAGMINYPLREKGVLSALVIKKTEEPPLEKETPEEGPPSSKLGRTVDDDGDFIPF